MLTMTPDTARINDTLHGLQRAQQARIARNPQRPNIPQFRTLPDGRVMHQSGSFVFTPSVEKKGK